MITSWAAVKRAPDVLFCSEDIGRRNGQLSGRIR